MSKKTCIIFGNCQGGAVKQFLEFSNFYDIYNVNTYANWEMIKNNESIPIRYLQSADLVIYQPLTDVHNCYSTNKNNPESFFNILKDTCNTIAFPRIHNNAVFPIFKKRKYGNEIYGRINNKVSCIDELMYLYDNNLIDYDFTNRMLENYEISKKKEADCEVKIIDFITKNVHKEKLFLTQDHPTSFVFSEVTRQICDILELDYNVEKGNACPENMVGLPDSVHDREDKQYPISRYAIDYFGFEYTKTEHPDANNFYKSNTIKYFLEK
jgi:hypothetical protein